MTEFGLSKTSSIELETSHGCIEIEGVENPPICIDGDKEDGDGAVLIFADTEEQNTDKDYRNTNVANDIIDLSNFGEGTTFNISPEQFKGGVDIPGAAYITWNHGCGVSPRKTWVYTDGRWRHLRIYTDAGGLYRRFGHVQPYHPYRGVTGHVDLGRSDAVSTTDDACPDYPNRVTDEEYNAIHRAADVVRALQEYRFGDAGTVTVRDALTMPLDGICYDQSLVPSSTTWGQISATRAECDVVKEMMDEDQEIIDWSER